jgi:DNA polymerase III subunit delta
MSAIAHRDADRYIERPDRAHFLFLVFGADQGLISERSRRLLAAIAPDGAQTQNIIDLAGDAIAQDPLVLVDEAHSIGLFDGPSREIRVSLGGKSILPALEMIERSPPTSSSIVLIAGELKRDAQIRKWIERQPFAASIECSPDDARDIQRLLDAELKRANLSIEPEAREILSEMLGDDRLSTRSEIEKLLLYAKDQNTVTVEHVHDILLDATAVNLDAVLSGTFIGQPNRIIEATSKLSLADIDVNRLFAAALRYALAIHRARAEIDSGASPDEALQILLRLINGFKRKSEVTSELRQAQTVKTAGFLNAIYIAIKELRQKNILSDERFSRLMLAMARSMQNANRKRT